MKILFIFLILFLIPSVYALETTSTNYISNVGIVSGAGISSSNNYNTTVLVGQNVIGTTNSTSYSTYFGFLGKVIALEPKINLSFGPPLTSLFRFALCGPDFENSSATPQNQTNTYGIDYVCNSGIGKSGTIQVKLSGALNTGWTWFVSNSSNFINNLTLTNSYQTIYSNLDAGLCTYVWHKSNCSYVTENPGTYATYQIA